jgi:hypothetical protein
MRFVDLTGFWPDGATSPLTKLANGASQVAGYSREQRFQIYSELR